MSTPIATIDWRNLPLGAGGRSLIEASAGTGKTWTVSVLYLRLILEFALSPRQIVVTTFTNAAAQELRERLRARLLWAERQAQSDATGDADTAALDAHWLHARWRVSAAPRAQDLARIRLAIAELDVAPIGTLHGLCRNIVADHPFACGSAFQSGDLIASDTLVAELAADLLRHLQQGDADSVLVQLQQRYQPEITRYTLTRHLRLCLMPDAIVPCLDMAQIELALPKVWAQRLRALVARDALFTKSCALRKHWTALADVIADPTQPLPSRNLDNALKNAAKLNGVCAKGKSDPDIAAAVAFSQRCVAILEPLRHRPAQAFWQAAAHWARTEARKRLQNRNQHTFDDLLLSVHDALQRDRQSRSGPGLADALYRTWPVALVDEFQDTDGIQYGILEQIYRAADGAERGRLVMIGDPKQAIYRFRGGDIHAYLRAARTVPPGSRMSLDVNHRSSTRLVAACNAFYAIAGATLGDDDASPDTLKIRYRPVQASGRQDTTPYCLNGEPVARPLCVHYLAAAPEGSAQRNTLALRVCANQIAQMLQSGTHRIGNRPLQPSDIAVLLPSNGQVEALRALLQERAVPCIASNRSSVFAGDTARDLHVVLYGIVHCHDTSALRAAAATRLWGSGLAELRQWGDDSASWQAIARQFHDWLALWQRQGVHVVIAELIALVATRFLQTARGERVLTDLRHLAELLQAQSELTRGSEALLAWLGEQRAGGDGDEDAADAQQLRIESDQKRVRLMTLHASKGLEFSIVFLPLMWAHGELRESGLYLLSDLAGGPRRIDSSDAGKAQHRQELFDERFRLLYVALTRAIHGCHLFALSPARSARANGQSSATGTARSALDVMLARMQPALDSAERNNVSDTIAWCDGWQPLSLHVLSKSDDGALARQPARALPPASLLPMAAKHSFTTLSHGGRQRADALEAPGAAADEADAAAAAPLSLLAPAPEQPLPPHPELNGLASIRGKAIGNAIHSIFEHRAIGQPLSAQKPLLRHWLDFHAVPFAELPAAMLVDHLARRLQAALAAPLGAEHAPHLCLDALAAHAMRAEMAFYFPLPGVSMRALAQACAAHGEPGLVPADARTLIGLMNGKIDLIFQHQQRFYLLDYKGNWLGADLAAYQGAALHAAMDAAHYRFQALLYTVALDRYLRQRLGAAYRRSQHLGECFYLFVRAAGLADGAGIWRHRFGDALLDAVNAVLAGSAADVELA